MARRFFKKFMPQPNRVREGKFMRMLGKVRHDPALWRLNRHSVARGVGLGLFWGFIPVPLQTLWAALTAIRLRGNVAFAVLMPWVAFFFLWPAFYGAYWIGLLILHEPPVNGFFDHWSSWRWWWENRRAVLPFLVGSVPVAAAMGVAGYFAVQGFWRWMLGRRIAHRKERLAVQAREKVHTS
jgi:hypothetical protein